MRRIKTGKTDSKGEDIVMNIAGTYRHAEGTTRRVYKDLKKDRGGI